MHGYNTIATTNSIESNKVKMSTLPRLYPSTEAKKKWKETIEKGNEEYGRWVSNPDETKSDPSIIKCIRAKVVFEIINRTLHTEEFKKECKLKTPNDKAKYEVYENGSLKQGTTVSTNFNLDLVLFSGDESLKKEECLKNDGYPDQLGAIDTYFKTKSNFKDRYEHLKTDKTELRFKFTLEEKPITIDVTLKLSYYWENTKDLFDTIAAQETWEKKKLFFPGTIKLQTEYITYVDKDRSVCSEIHRSIQRAKAWRDIQDWPTDKEGVVQKPDSYLISLLVIKAFYNVPQEERDGKPLNSFAEKVTEKFKDLIVNKLAVLADWDELNDPKDEKLTEIKDKYPHLLPTPWWLIDPANPANNVYVSGMPGIRKDLGWQTFAKKVSTIDLSKDAEKILENS